MLGPQIDRGGAMEPDAVSFSVLPAVEADRIEAGGVGLDGLRESRSVFRRGLQLQLEGGSHLPPPLLVVEVGANHAVADVADRREETARGQSEGIFKSCGNSWRQRREVTPLIWATI